MYLSRSWFSEFYRTVFNGFCCQNIHYHFSYSWSDFELFDIYSSFLVIVYSFELLTELHFYILETAKYNLPSTFDLLILFQKAHNARIRVACIKGEKRTSFFNLQIYLWFFRWFWFSWWFINIIIIIRFISLIYKKNLE